MDQVIECPCGTVLQADGVSAVVGQARTHAKEVHDMDLTEEQATAMVRPA